MEQTLNEIPQEFLDYLKDAWDKIKYEGEIKALPKYGGSCFVVFKNGRAYRLNISLYDMNTVTLD